MKTEPIRAKDLESYYNRLRKFQRRVYGPDYLLIHDEIRKRVSMCDTYTEMGVKQGTTLAAALLEHPKVVRAYDISLQWYKLVDQLYKRYAKKHGIDLQVCEKPSTECSIQNVDVLFLDTCHRFKHVYKELLLHSSRVNRFIVIHDTMLQTRENIGRKRTIEKKVVSKFLGVDSNWERVTNCTKSVGFMTLERI